MEEIKQTVVVVLNEVCGDLDSGYYDWDNPTYVTITYENAIGYQLGSGFLGVQAVDGSMTIFPQERIRQVTVSPKE